MWGCRHFWWILGFLALVVSASVGRGEDIVIGMSAAFHGPSRGLGTELYRGAMACFSDVNARGGIYGRKISLKAYDDGYESLRAIDNTVRLIDEDKVFLLFGYVGTPTTTRILPLLRQRQSQSLYLFFPFTGATPLRQSPYADFVFNFRASYSEETQLLVKRFVEVGRKKIAVFYQIDTYGRSGWTGVRKALAAEGLSIAAEATYRRGTGYSDSMEEQVKLLRQADPDAVICVGAYAACAAFIRDSRDAGWDVPIANVSFVGSENLLALLKQEGARSGKDYTGNLLNTQVVPSYNRVELPAVKEYRQLSDRYRGSIPPELSNPDYDPLPYSYVGFEGFLDAKLLVAVLREIGPELRRESIRDAAERIHDYQIGIDCPVSFGAYRHQGLTKVYCTTTQDGRFVPVDDWQRWQK
jgi:ABC-type branched-subunit amino acid transport system substrate-binding protein